MAQKYNVMLSWLGSISNKFMIDLFQDRLYLHIFNIASLADDATFNDLKLVLDTNISIKS